MINIVMAKIKTTKPIIVSQPVGSHVQGIQAACPKPGITADVTEMPMTMTKVKNLNDAVNAKATLTSPHAAIAHVSRHAQALWGRKVSSDAPAR